MLGWLSKKADTKRTARDLYGAIVTEARRDTYYAWWGVADRPEARLEMILVFLVATLGRLEAEGAAGQAVARALNEHFVTDLDDNFREMGIGDLVVPKRIKKAAAALFDRHRDYLAALAAGDHGVLKARIAEAFGVAETEPLAERIAAHLRVTATHLASQAGGDILGGRVHFAPPAV
jgi:cytochrome b pre-mRNA-processing protein 3